MKNKRRPFLTTISAIAIIFLVSCSGVEIQYQPNSATVKRPDKILIGPFENRIQEYNPFIIKDFRDALKFEFLKLGYNAELVSVNESRKGNSFNCAENKIEPVGVKEQLSIKTNQTLPDNQAIKICCEKYKSDLFIKGSISITEADYLADSKASTFISLMIYDGYGEKTGEAHYSGTLRMDNIKTIKTIAKDFAVQIHSQLSTIKQDDDKRGILDKIMNILTD